MALTQSQLVILSNDIDTQTNPEFVAYRDAGNTGAMASWYNVNSTVIVWKSSCQTQGIGQVVNYIAVEALTDANRNRIITFYTMNPTAFDPSREDIRIFWANTFSGALGGQGQATRDALEAFYRRAATRGETLYDTGTGTTASPAKLGWEGSITNDDIVQALALP